VQHEEECPPAWFGEWLGEAGLGLDVVLAHEGAAVPTRLDGYDALLVLGGGMGADDDDAVAWLPATKRLIRSVVARRQPFLGICLGHQLAAAALGGQVVTNPAGRASGLTPVRLTDAGETDRLLSAVPEGAVAVQWNNDIVATLPPGAVRLASAPDGTVQAARFGAAAWGVQFHPEASPEVFRGWTLKPSTPQTHHDGRPVRHIPADVEAAREGLRWAWCRLAHRFARLVTSPVSVA